MKASEYEEIRILILQNDTNPNIFTFVQDHFSFVPLDTFISISSQEKFRRLRSDYPKLTKPHLVLPEIVQAGDPVLRECAEEVALDEIGSERIQKIIDNMIAIMSDAPGCGLAAPQIGVPLQMIVVEDKEEYIRFTLKEEAEAQERHSFDL